MDVKEKIEIALNYNESNTSLPLSKQLVRKLSKEKEGFIFDKEITTFFGEKTTVYGFLEDETKMLFVSAKCEEPYSFKNHTANTSYLPLYDYINENIPYELSINVMENTITECFAYGERIRYFDLLETIETLVGIATKILDKALKNKQIDFIYLLFDPTELDFPAVQKEEIETIYERLCYEANLIDFASLLRTIFTFLKQEKYKNAISDEEIEEIVFKFTFALASHELYPILLGIDQ